MRRSTCSANSTLTQYSTSSTTQALLDPYSSPSSRISVNRNCNLSPHMDRLSRHYYLVPLSTICYHLRNESLRDNINAAKTLVIILIVFFVCWFPFFLTYTLSFVGKVSFTFLETFFVYVASSILIIIKSFTNIGINDNNALSSDIISQWLDKFCLLARLYELLHQPLHICCQVQGVSTCIQRYASMFSLSDKS